jgi:hypothetical protein
MTLSGEHSQSEYDGKERVPAPVRNQILAVQSVATQYTAKTMPEVQSQHKAQETVN